MALDYCTECQCIEGGFREATVADAQAAGEDFIESDQVLVCEQCGALGSHQGIREHDEYDMER